MYGHCLRKCVSGNSIYIYIYDTCSLIHEELYKVKLNRTSLCLYFYRYVYYKPDITIC